MKLQNLNCPMRDGTALATDLYLPDQGTAFPMILYRTPYGKNFFPKEPLYCLFPRLIEDGYGIAVQDLRGTGESDGTLGLNGHNEHQDGYDAVEWLAAQPFCNGHVGMFGLSYPGFVQTAAAAFAPPHLDAICPFMSPSLHPFGIRQPHTLHMMHLFWAYSQIIQHPEKYITNAGQREQRLALVKENMEHLSDLLFELPLNECKAAMIPDIPILQDYLEVINGVESKAFWEKMNMPIDYNRVNTAAFFGTGWFDGAKEWTIAGYKAARNSMNQAVSENACLLIGPWPHGGDLPQKIEDVDFGPDASGDSIDVMGCMHRWFDKHLKHEDTSAFEDRVKYFMRGENRWYTAAEWPPRDSVFVNWYTDQNGVLTEERPEEESCAVFDADPMNPSPSSHFDQSGRTLLADWSFVKDRDDILVFVSKPLETSLFAAGTVQISLYASSSAEDTDFVCRLVDIDPMGRQYELASGLIRASYRNGEERAPITPDEITLYHFEVGNTANCFAAGHRIGIHICSFLYPDHNRTLNTYEPSSTSINWCIAHQKIYSGGRYATRIQIPVLMKQS